MRLQRWILLTALMLTAPVVAQEEDGSYFALSSTRTFAPGEKVSIQMWAQGIRGLDFRLYRVNDPSEFLSQLRDAHSFGNQTASLPKDSSPLSRFSRWKRNLRAKAQLFIREQFTPDARAAWHASDSPAAPKKTADKGTTYAPIPVLNDQQLIKSWRENVSTKQRWEEQPVEVPVKDPGLYLLEAHDGKLRAYTLVSVSAMTVLTKTQPGESLARVVDRISGAALPNIDVEFRSFSKSHTKAKTDANGFAKLTAADTSDVFVIATRGKDVSFDALSEYAFAPNAERLHIGYTFTDRPVYRPGHKVHFKSILRKQAPFGYAMPDLKDATVEVSDAEGKPIYRKELSLSAFGSIKGELELPITASLGYYGIKISLDSFESYGSFQVEEYKKPEYEVKIRTSKSRVVQGETVEAVINGRYFFGEPVKGAKVTYTVRRARYYPYWYEPDTDGGYEQTEETEGDGGFFNGDQGDEKVATLDDNGELKISLPTPVVESDYVFRIEARVMDEGNREVTGYGVVTATHGTYMAIINPVSYVASPNTQSAYKITLKDYDGKPIQGDFKVDLQRWTYSSKEYQPVSSTTGRTGPEGDGRVSFLIPSSGSYRLIVSSRTPEGRNVKNECWTWASGYDSSYGNSEEESVKLIPDKKKYAAGETAKVLILTAVPDADVWISTESRSVVNSRSIKAPQAGGVTVEIPIKSEYQPNVWVTATYVKAGKLYSGQVSLRVPPVERELSIEVVPSKPEFKPGEPARYDVAVKDHRGQGVAAEVSLGVVDEALYGVQKDTTQTPLSFFYGNIYNQVNSSNSLSYYFRGEAGKRAMRLARIKPSLGQLKADSVGDPRVRKAFPDTAFWTADLITDSSGKGRVEFAFPDALTQWRTTARGVTVDTKVGHAINRVIVRKNFMLRMVSPRFLMEGDEVSIGVIAQNYLTTAKDAKISLTGTNLEFLDGAEKSVNVEPKGSQKVEFRVRVKPGNESVLTAKGLTNEESDAMELTIPVKGYGVQLSKGAAGTLSDGQSAKASLEGNGGHRIVELRVSPSMAGSLFGALEYLTQFPYGCTEQTMSSFLPNIIVTRALNELGIKSNIKPAELQKKVDAGQTRLYDYQHDDGAWGWWKNDASHPFMTAHVVSGLKAARSAGYSINEDNLKRAETWLRSEFRRQSDARADLRAYIAMALGTKPELEEAFRQRDRMTSYGLAFLGLGLDSIKDPRAIEIAQALEAQAKQTASEAWWPGTRDPLLDFPNDIAPETTAHVLKLLSRTRPKSALLPKAASWLVAHKDQGEWWNSTKQTAMVIYGVTDYLKASGELKPSNSVTVRLNGKTVLEKDFTEADATALNPVTLSLPADAANNVEVAMKGTGRVYWGAQLKYFSPEENRKAADGTPITASREYFRLVPKESGGNTTYDLEPLTGDVKPGDSIAVLVNVSAKDWKYVLIEDSIPSGMELVTNENTYNLSGRPSWWRYSWAQREYRDDRVAFFRTWFTDDSQFFYVMKAVNPGKFRVPPTRVQPMYQPDQVATGRATNIEVKP
jgi:hypothetical protein